MYPEFPTLTKDQIECKVKQVTAKGVVVLLYKTARVDMDMLDNIVGPMNWQNSYEDIDGVLHCSIAIRNSETNEWISKSDCGIESRADGDGNEKKGEASDAFKRAGFRWGIGRELYSAPFTFISVETKQNSRGNYEMTDRFAKFSVGEIVYDENRKISKLIIVDNNGKEVFKFPKNAIASKPAAAKPAPKETDPKPAPVITADAAEDSAPWEENPKDGVTQAMLTNYIEACIKEMDTDKRRAVTKEVKKIIGSVDFRNVGDPQKRRELYNYFWNISNEIA